ncbi:MAG: NUDIX domain-containing protein [Dehalococcoidia bacterium]
MANRKRGTVAADRLIGAWQRGVNMRQTQVIQGDRVGKSATLSCSSCAAVFDDSGRKILLTRRADNGLWCLPGGCIEPGESAQEACVREVLEETGLVVEAGKLVGVYSSPDRVTEYPDGNRYQTVSLCFEARRVGGELGVSGETTEFGYFSLAEIQSMSVMENHWERIRDASARLERTFVR